MLRKRTRSLKKDQQTGQLTMSDSGSESYLQPDNHMGHSHKANSFFTVPGLFVGLSHKGLSDCDSVRSPTSPLDSRMFSNIGNPHKSLRSSHGGQQKSWDCNKVGLSILDSLDDDDDDDDGKGYGKVLQSSESKNILFGPRVRSKTANFQSHTDPFQAPKSLPRNFAIFPRTLTKSPLQKDSSDVLFEIGEGPFESETFGRIRSCSLDSCRSFSSMSRLAGQNLKASSLNFSLHNITTQADCPPQLLGGSSNTNNFSNTNLTYTPQTQLQTDPLSALSRTKQIPRRRIRRRKDGLRSVLVTSVPRPNRQSVTLDLLFSQGKNICAVWTGIQETRESSSSLSLYAPCFQY